MPGLDTYTPTAQSAVERLLHGVDFRRFGIGLAIGLAGVVGAAALTSPDTMQMLFAGAIVLLLAIGIVAVAGLATGMLVISSSPTRSGVSAVLLDRLPEGVLVTAADGRIVYANPAYRDIAGRRDGEALGIEEIFAGKVAAAEPVYRLMQAVKRGARWQEEFRVAGTLDRKREARDGASWYRVSVDVTDGQNVGFAATDGSVAIWQLADITSERQRQEEAFGKLQEIIDYLDQAPAGFFSFDGNGRIDYLNATLADWLGLDLADAVASQLSLRDIVSGDGAMLLAQAPGSSPRNEPQVYDLDLIRHDGTLLPVRLLHQKADSGSAGRSRTLVLNRAPGAESAEDLRAAEVRFARFFHSAPIAIATLDKEGRVGSTNAAFARMFATSLCGRAEGAVDLVALVAPDSREEVVRAIELAVSGQVRVTPLNVTFAGDKEHTGSFYFSPVSSAASQGGGEEFGGAILYAIDTTDQRTLEMQMVQGQKMQAVGQLAGGIAHDFNNLLTAIIHATDELFSRHRPTDPSFKDIVSIKQTAHRAAALVRQILAFSRRQTMRPEVLNLNDVISNLSIMLDRILGDNVQLNMERSRDLWMVRADLTQFEQVIINLSVNARDAMPAGGMLSIATSNVSQRESTQMPEQGMTPGEYVLVRVSDTGSGMTPEVMAKVFEPFFTTKGVGKGTGLGLSTVYGIVKQTGGFIYIDSEVGKGTAFRIYLPRHEEDAESEAEATAKEKQNARKGKPDLTGTETILLVEDEETVRGFSARALRKIGYEVFEAGTGIQALEVMNEVEGRIDLVVSDVMMPEMDGPTMAREMRRTNPDLKIVFVSGYAQDVLDEDDDFAFLPKPYGAKDLAAKVKEVLAK